MKTIHAAEEIAYAVVPSPWGNLMMAESARGVCSILLGEEEAVLLADLARRFPKARLVRGEAALQQRAGQAVCALESGAEFPFPLDARGTEFQQTVWQALRGIPRGQTVSYTEVARRIGRPDAVRAVAGAIGANPLAVVVPCHRVIGSDGSLTGYHWGLEIKSKLLEMEQEA